MTGDAYSQPWPGRGGWGHRAHGPGSHCWAFAEGKGRHGRGFPSPEDLERWAAMRGMRAGPFGGGHRGRARGRARRGDVRLGLLLLLAEEPRNGYQLIQTIEERSDGRWRPSPGSVYPTLAQLEDEGLVRATEADGGRHFEITDAGREHLATRSDEPPPWEPADEAGANALSDLGPLIMQIGKAAWQVAQVGDQRQTARAIELLSETRRGLYRILAEDQA
ncbi:MAG: PadR family transcriptional regulator [Solirubrobacterales bacterium]|nr:MAG: PadR family transcriptional regulator [Solirubrobacterales bacterium]